MDMEVTGSFLEPKLEEEPLYSWTTFCTVCHSLNFRLPLEFHEILSCLPMGFWGELINLAKSLTRKRKSSLLFISQVKEPTSFWFWEISTSSILSWDESFRSGSIRADLAILQAKGLKELFSIQCLGYGYLPLNPAISLQLRNQIKLSQLKLGLQCGFVCLNCHSV